MGRRTTTAACWTVRALLDGHLSDYRRVFSRAPWRPAVLARVLSAAAVLELVPKGMRVVLSADDTTARHKGDHVYGPFDAAQGEGPPPRRGPLHAQPQGVEVGKWVVLAADVRLPYCQRAWALPVKRAATQMPELPLDPAQSL